MDKDAADFKADEFIKLILQREENLFGTAALNTEAKAKAAAQFLATFRQELVQQLQKQ
jgi:hypothetical protein